MDSNLSETQNVAQSKQSEQESISEEHLWNCSSLSVTRRWDRLRSEFKDLGEKVEEWRQKDTQAIADLGSLAPSTFGFKSSTICCKKCACKTCNALATLNEACERLVNSKQQLVRSEKEHADAKKEHAETVVERADAENWRLPTDPSAKKDRTLELLGERVANKAELVSSSARLVSSNARLVSSNANSVFQGANLIYMAHSGVEWLLEALWTASNITSLVTSSDLDLAKSPEDLPTARNEFEVGSSSSRFGTLCRLSVVGLDELDFLPTLDTDH